MIELYIDTERLDKMSHEWDELPLDLRSLGLPIPKSVKKES